MVNTDHKPHYASHYDKFTIEVASHDQGDCDDE
jgi:hypothetical protein